MPATDPTTSTPTTGTGDDAAAKSREADHGMLAGAIRIVSGLTILSRFAGLARDIITARIFGDSALGSAFGAAYAIPNLFRRLFGEGALSAAFLPEYAQLRRDDPRKAEALSAIVIRILLLATGAITLVIEVLLLLRLFVGFRDEGAALSVRLIMLMLPMMPMVCLTAVLGGMLQARGKFGPPAAAPVLLNVFQIVAGSLFWLELVRDATTTAYLVGVAAVLASIAQIAWSYAALKEKITWPLGLVDVAANTDRVRARFIPAMLGLGTLQLNTFLDMAVAMWPTWVGPMMFGREVTLDASSNAILRYTQTIYQFPLGVFGIAVATAVFPLLSRSADRPEEFASMLRRGLRLSFFIGLPASLGLWLVRYDLIHTMYAAGSSKFSLDGVDRAARVLAGFAPAIWAYSLNHVLTRAFYAKGDTSTPMRVSLVGVALNVALNFTLIWPMREAGLAWATAISATVQCLLLATLCGKRLGVSPVDRETGIAFMKVLAAAAIMGGAVFGLLQLWPEVQTWWARVLRLAATCIAGAGVFVGIARAMRLPEMRWITQRAPKGSGGAAAGMSFE